MQITAVRTLTRPLVAPVLQASTAGNTASLTWAPPTPTGQSVIAGYRVYKGPSANGPFAQVGGALPPAQLSLSDTLSGTQFYRIEAFDQYVTGSSSLPLSCVPTAGAVKWNPGPYGAQGIATLGGGSVVGSSSVNNVLNELAKIAPYPGIIGYRILTTMGFWEQGKDNFAPAFAVTDQILTALAQMTPPRHAYFTYQPNVDTSGSQTDLPGTGGFYIPAYIISDPATYGPALGRNDPGHGGYYGQASGGFGANVCNANVRARIINQFQQIAVRYDDPTGGALVNGVRLNSLFEGISIVEDSNWTPSLNPGSNTGLTYNEFTPAVEAVLAAAVAAFPRTNIGMQADTNGPQSNSSAFEQWLVAHRVAPGSADTFGHNTFVAQPTLSFLQEGLKSLFGTASSGNADLRPLCRPQLDVQSIELSSSPKYHGTTATATDIAIAMRDDYQASHYFFTMMFANSGNTSADGTTFNFQGLTIPIANDWSHAAPVLSSISTVTSYPPNYP